MGSSRRTVRDLKSEVRGVIEERAGEFVRLGHDVHVHPEPAYAEARAATSITRLLAAEGFDVEAPLGGMPTAFAARIGDSPLHIALCAEYDVYWDGNERGCGHNLIAGAAVAAAVGLGAVSAVMPLRLSVLGTPGEHLVRPDLSRSTSRTAGKITLLRAGAFDGIHAVLMVHPRSGSVRTLFPPSNPEQIPALRQDPLLAIAYRQNAERNAHGSLPDRRHVDPPHVVPLDRAGNPGLDFSSWTDLADVSLLVPSLRASMAIDGDARPGTRAFAQCADTDDAYRSMLDAAVALAWTAIDAATDKRMRASLVADTTEGSRGYPSSSANGNTGCKGGRSSSRSIDRAVVVDARQLTRHLVARRSDAPLSARVPAALLADRDLTYIDYAGGGAY